MLEHQHRHLDRSVEVVADVRVHSVASVGRDVEAPARTIIADALGRMQPRSPAMIVSGLPAGREVSGHAVVKVFDLRRAPDVLALVEDRSSVAVVARHTPAGEGQHARDVVSLGTKQRRRLRLQRQG